MFFTFALLAPVQHCEAADVPVSGTIGSNTTWTSGNTYIVTAAITVSAGVTLTVEDDVIIKFDPGQAMTVNGTLDVQGTSVNPVYLTDSRDDTVGGDTNGDADATSPTPGGWQGIRVNDGGSTNFVHAEMRYAGGIKFSYNGAWNYTAILKGGNSGAITTDNFTLIHSMLNGIFIAGSSAAHNISDSHFEANGRNGIYGDTVANLTVTDSTFQGSGWYGIHLIESGGSISGSTFETSGLHGLFLSNFSGNVTGNSFNSNTQCGFYHDALTHPTFTGNVFSGNTLAPVALKADGVGMEIPASNTLDGPIMIDGGTTTVDANWLSPFTYQVNGLTVGAGTTLTVTPPRVVKFSASAGMSVSGTLDMPGTSGDMIYLTDWRDDTVGGDSNNDADATAPVAGGWAGIAVGDGGSANFVHTEMRYAGHLRWSYKGAWNYTAILKHGNSGTITTDNMTLIHSSYHGLFIFDSSAAHNIYESHFESISRYGIYAENVSDITIEDTTSTGCGWNGVHLLNSGGTIGGNAFESNGQNGLFVADFTGSITGNSFDGNTQYGFYHNGLTHPSFTSNSFSGNTLAPIGLKGDGVGLEVPASNTLDGAITIDGGTTTADASWLSPFTYHVNALVVGAGTTLTIVPPRVVKFAWVSSMSVSGTLDIPGTDSDPVYLTEVRDDTVGGDSNGDGDTTSPTPGGWGGIAVGDGGSASFSYTEMRYPGEMRFNYKGQWNYASILKHGTTGTISADHLTLINSNKHGLFIMGTDEAHSVTDSHLESIGRHCIFLDDVSNISITDSTIRNCSWTGIYMLESDGTISGSTIRDNATYGIETKGAYTNPMVIKNIIKNNLEGVHSSALAEPLIGVSPINGNDIYGNTNYGVFNGDSSVTIHAENNYWGDATGPYHPTTNPGGGGDTVSDYVLYGSYAAQPVNEVLPVLTVELAGSGGGLVTSIPEGINCGVDCSETYPPATQVTLTAVPDPDSTFIGWSGGGCSGTESCVVEVDEPVTVTAEFYSDMIFWDGFD